MSQDPDTFSEVMRVVVAALLIPIVIALLFHFSPLSF